MRACEGSSGLQTKLLSLSWGSSDVSRLMEGDSTSWKKDGVCGVLLVLDVAEGENAKCDGCSDEDDGVVLPPDFQTVGGDFDDEDDDVKEEDETTALRSKREACVAPSVCCCCCCCCCRGLC